MILQPNFQHDPIKLITTPKNRRFAKFLLSEGMEWSKVSKIMIQFFSYKVILRDIFKKANNPEAIEMRAWHKTVRMQYNKAIKCLEFLLNNNSIPSTTQKTITKDVDALRQRADFLTQSLVFTPSIKPEPLSINQMIVFQSWALYQYLRKFKSGSTDKEIYDFMAELFRNFYKDTVIGVGLRHLTGDLLKNNYIDNAYKVRRKYKSLEEAIKPFIL